MLLINETKLYDFENKGELLSTDIHLTLNPKDNLDCIIYILICSQVKTNEGKSMEASSRLRYAFDKLRNYIKEQENG